MSVPGAYAPHVPHPLWFLVVQRCLLIPAFETLTEAPETFAVEWG